eukprot:9331904-Pyramimonas_sp.AAC.1
MQTKAAVAQLGEGVGVSQIRRGEGTNAATFPSVSPLWTSWEILVATAGLTSKFWLERTQGEVSGVL